MTPAIQSGWDAKLSVAIETRDVFAPTIAATGEGEFGAPAFSGDCRLICSPSANRPSNRTAIPMGMAGHGLEPPWGIRSPSFRLPLAGIPASARLEAGGGLRATKYYRYWLVSANPAIVGQAGLDIHVSSKVALGISLPLEFAWKSGGTALMFGVGAAIQYR